MADLKTRLLDEAGQCRNDGADDIARLLDEAAAALAQPAQAQEEPPYIGACIAGGRLGVTVMQRSADKRVTILATAEMDVASLKEHDCIAQATVASAQPAGREALTADDMREPKNGAAWQVHWWNESARLMLPRGYTLASFQSYRNGTLTFTIKHRSDAHGITGEGV